MQRNVFTTRTNLKLAKDHGIAKKLDKDNETLEFLGDAVLGAVVADILHRWHPSWKEGECSVMFYAIKCLTRMKVNTNCSESTAKDSLCESSGSIEQSIQA